jgi:hypothetical protein
MLVYQRVSWRWFKKKPLQPEALDFKPQSMDRLKEIKHLK